MFIGMTAREKNKKSEAERNTRSPYVNRDKLRDELPKNGSEF